MEAHGVYPDSYLCNNSNKPSIYSYHAGYMWLGEGSFISDESVYILLLLLSWSYFTASFTDPGSIPVNYSAPPGTTQSEAFICKFCNASTHPSLQNVRSMHSSPRPPLSVDWQLCGISQP